MLGTGCNKGIGGNGRYWESGRYWDALEGCIGGIQGTVGWEALIGEGSERRK